MTAIDWPVKRREMFSHYLDSRRWNGFAFRDGDIVIATYAKSGTTWMQQIISQLVFGGVEGLAVHRLSPWVDLRVLPPEAFAALDTQTHRRFMKTHLPIDALVFSPRARYIFIGRDGRDVAWSLHNHHANGNEDYFRLYNGGLPEGYPPLEPAPEDPRQFYRQWLARDGLPFWPFWSHLRSWWEVRRLPNVLLLHYNDLKADLPGVIGRIAGFLDIPLDGDMLARVTAHSSFDYMKAHAEEVTPRGGSTWKGGARTFINKGINGRWRDMLTAGEIEAYEQRAIAELGPDCARWLADGGDVP